MSSYWNNCIHQNKANNAIMTKSYAKSQFKTNVIAYYWRNYFVFSFLSPPTKKKAIYFLFNIFKANINKPIFFSSLLNLYAAFILDYVKIAIKSKKSSNNCYADSYHKSRWREIKKTRNDNFEMIFKVENSEPKPKSYFFCDYYY